jgi:hypothetical protein
MSTGEMTDNSASVVHPPRLLNLIGYWASGAERQEESPGWPDPKDLIGNWDFAHRRSVVKYLSSGITFRRYLGFAQCRICDASLGSDEMTDGTWAWPQGLEHYVQAHNVLLPADFIESARAPALSLLAFLRNEFACPETWIQGSGGSMPIDPTSIRTVILNPNTWLDWAAAMIPATPAPDAITFDEANHLCERLSHREWKAYIEERFGRWRVICRSGIDEKLIYVERCRAEILQHHLLVWRYADPDALLRPEQAQAVASEFDGEWGVVAIVAATEDRWLVWVKPPDCEWPTKSEIEQAEKLSFGFVQFTPGGSEAFVCPRLDEMQWRMVLDRTRRDARRSRPLPQLPNSKKGYRSSLFPHVRQNFIRMLRRWRVI